MTGDGQMFSKVFKYLRDGSVERNCFFKVLFASSFPLRNSVTPKLESTPQKSHFRPHLSTLSTSSKHVNLTVFEIQLKVNLEQTNVLTCNSHSAPFLKAYNGFTSPASFTVVVRAVGPIRSDEVSLEERDFLRLICYKYIKVRTTSLTSASPDTSLTPRGRRGLPLGVT